MTEEKKTMIEQLREDVSINDADLDGCMTTQAALYAKATFDANTAKTRADIAHAKAYKELRSRFIAKGVKCVRKRKISWMK